MGGSQKLDNFHGRHMCIVPKGVKTTDSPRRFTELENYTNSFVLLRSQYNRHRSRFEVLCLWKINVNNPTSRFFNYCSELINDCLTYHYIELVNSGINIDLVFCVFSYSITCFRKLVLVTHRVKVQSLL